ncbi:MAG: PTS glucose transporter subunit IIA [Clostridiaceae bacterium]
MKKTKIDLYMPAKGKIMPLKEVNNYLPEDVLDGLGVGLIPEEDIFYAPVSGEVVLVGDYHNTVGIAVNPDLTILIHCGLNSEKTEGRGFSSYVRVGDKVTVGDKIIFMDLEYVSNRADTTTPIMISNSRGVNHVDIDYTANDTFQKFMEIYMK